MLGRAEKVLGATTVYFSTRAMKTLILALRNFEISFPAICLAHHFVIIVALSSVKEQAIGVVELPSKFDSKTKRAVFLLGHLKLLLST